MKNLVAAVALSNVLGCGGIVDGNPGSSDTDWHRSDAIDFGGASGVTIPVGGGAGGPSIDQCWSDNDPSRCNDGEYVVMCDDWDDLPAHDECRRVSVSCSPEDVADGYGTCTVFLQYSCCPQTNL